MATPPRPAQKRNQDTSAHSVLKLPRLLVTLTIDELEELVVMAVAKALDAQSPAPDYADRAATCQRLGISAPTLDRLCRLGMPHVYIGDSRRFKAADVDAWLATRSKSAGKP